MRQTLRSRTLAIAMAMFLGTLGGCTRQSTSGDSVTYGYGWFLILLVVLIGIVLLGIGGYRIADNRRIAASQGRRKKKREPSENEGLVGLLFGIAIVVGGLGLLGILAPSLYLSYITVTPEKVVIRDSLFWLSSSSREIPYADTAGLNVEEREVRGRRGAVKTKKYLHIARISGVAETIEMQAMHRDAWPDWEAKYQTFLKQNAPAAPPTVVSNATAPAAESAPPATIASTQGGTSDLAPPSGEAAPASGGAMTSPAKAPADKPAVQPPKIVEPTLENPGPEIKDVAPYKRGYKILAGPKLREATIQSVHELFYVRVKYLDDGTEALVSHVDTQECEDVAYGDVIDEILHAKKGVAICVMKVAGQMNGAKVLEVYSDNKIRVGYLSGEEELVHFGQTLHPSALTGQSGVQQELVPVPESEDNPVASAPIDKSNLGPAIRSSEKVTPGMTLYAEFKGRWLPVSVIEPANRGKCRIHWIGWPQEFDTEWQLTKLKRAKE